MQILYIQVTELLVLFALEKELDNTGHDTLARFRLLSQVITDRFLGIEQSLVEVGHLSQIVQAIQRLIRIDRLIELVQMVHYIPELGILA